MRDYTKAWNKHDSAAIARELLSHRPTVAEQTASLERGFENLRAQGYHHSDILRDQGLHDGPGYGVGGHEVLAAEEGWRAAAAERSRQLLQPEEIRRRLAHHESRRGRRCGGQAAGVPGRIIRP